MVQAFTFYIWDTRFRVPTIAFDTLTSEARAREIATQRLAQSAHHTAVHVYCGDDLVCMVRRPESVVGREDERLFG